MTQEQKLSLTLDLNELNTVMAGLGKLPYEQCFLVVDTIRQQAGPQVQQLQQASGGGAMGPGSEG
jgi:hypothetical protein